MVKKFAPKPTVHPAYMAYLENLLPGSLLNRITSGYNRSKARHSLDYGPVHKVYEAVAKAVDFFVVPPVVGLADLTEYEWLQMGRRLRNLSDVGYSRVAQYAQAELALALRELAAEGMTEESLGRAVATKARILDAIEKFKHGGKEDAGTDGTRDGVTTPETESGKPH